MDLSRRLVAEGLGTAFLVCAVVGSGIMAETLTNNSALALLCNTLPTGAILVVLITMFGPVSGAHFNPAVSVALAMTKHVGWREVSPYVAVQIIGGLAGSVAAHLMFEQDAVQVSQTMRSGIGQWLGEIIATFGLVGTILAGLKFNRAAIPWLVGLYITSAYWFTASTSFANPAVAIARAISDTFSGIRPLDLPGFIIAQLVGAVLAVLLFRWLLAPETEEADPS